METAVRRSRRTQLGRLLLSALTGAVVLTMLGGCNVFGFAGAMVDSYRRTSTRTVKPETDVLQGKTFAVLVSTDRSIEEQATGVTAMLLARITDRLSDPNSDVGTTGVVPAAQVLQYMYDNPGWRAKSMADLAADLGGVQRLVFVELTEFRDKEPMNPYLYDGVAAGTISVVEVDSQLADYFSFERSVLVKFPDEQGRRPDEIPEAAVRTELLRRFVDRATWPFYTHEEPYYPNY